jgi:hypothetical protein
MKQNIHFFAFLNGKLQRKWIQPIYVKKNGEVNIFGRNYQVVDGKVELNYTERYPSVQSNSSYYYHKEMEDKDFYRIGGLNSRDYVSGKYLRSEGGSYREQELARQKAYNNENI